jgi:hypothetical protein
MTKPIKDEELAELPAGMREQFVPLDRRAAGLALGSYLALAILALTAVHLLFDAWILENVEFAQRYEYSGDPLWLLGQFFLGYEPTTWSGALIGAGWGALVGFVFGWSGAFLRNLVVAAWLVYVRSKARLRASREFLDQI